MGLSRKRKKELRKLRSKAEDLWQEQQGVLERAGVVAREASRQASMLTREQVTPRVVSAYDDRLKPGVDRGVEVTRAVVGTARDKVVHEVAPALAGVAASAVSVLDLARDVRGRLEKSTVSLTKTKKKSGPGAGTFVLIGVGVVALAGVAYAAWQTFRADDDLWIADDEPEAAPGDVDPKAPTV